MNDRLPGTRAILLCLLPACLAPAASCADGGPSTLTGVHTSSGTGGVGSGACTLCVTSADCAAGALCAQFAGDSYCAPDCSGGQSCGTGNACTPVSTVEGNPASVCIPVSNACGSGSSSGSTAGSSSGSATMCGILDGPTVPSGCNGCGTSHTCQANGCWGGWWCNTQTIKCQPPPSPSACGGSTGSSSGGTTSSSSSTGGTTSSGAVGPGGGSVASLHFAVVGDTRPPAINDTSGYPTAVITKIWQDVEALSPRPDFALTTGDYMFASTTGGQAAPQLALYLQARASFTNTTFPTMGNHECTGATTSNCGPGTTDGVTDNYTQFMNHLLAPLGISTPYYVIHVNSSSNAWTAKLVFVAANAWTTAQATWLQQTLAQPTTYTFVMRHESITASTAPGVSPSEQIIKQYPLTMRIVGHAHTFQYNTGSEIIIGNGGAPLAGSVNYGYLIAQQRADGAIAFTEYDYATNAANQTFAVKADGTPTP